MAITEKMGEFLSFNKNRIKIAAMEAQMSFWTRLVPLRDAPVGELHIEIESDKKKIWLVDATDRVEMGAMLLSYCKQEEGKCDTCPIGLEQGMSCQDAASAANRVFYGWVTPFMGVMEAAIARLKEKQ